MSFSKILILSSLFFWGLFSLSQSNESNSNNKNSKVDINNLANACQGKDGDQICRSLSRALNDYKNFEQRSIEVMLETANLGGLEIYTASGLSMLINRRITIKQKSFFSDKFFQTLDLKENEAVISLEYNF